MAIRKVLLIDDEEDIRTIGQICLSRVGGWETLVAPGGAEGLALALEEQPDVVLLDVMMPGMDGPTVLARLRADPRTAHIPVVFITARVQRGDLGHYVALGAHGAIPKPFDPMRLPAEIRKMVEPG
jgi:CheY-like chemotaxis protein